MTRAALFIALYCSSHSFAAPTLTSLFPAGGQRGTTVEVTASGTFDPWPVHVWTSDPSIEAKAAKEKGKLRITIAAETPPGIYWLRLYDDTGASALRPFLVGLHPDVLEIEPNDEPAKAQGIKGPASIHGKLSKNGDVDCYSIAAKKGEVLVASLDAHTPLRSPIDAVLQIVSADNAVVAENHDYRGLDPQVAYAVPADGTYVVRVFAFPAIPDSSIRHFGSELSVYRLTITTGPFVDYATPLANKKGSETTLSLQGWNLKGKSVRFSGETDRPAIAGYNQPVPIRLEAHDCFDFTSIKPTETLSPPFSLTGRLNERESTFSFKADKGKPLTLNLESASLGFALNPVVVIRDPEGKQLSKSEPAKLNSDLDVNINPPSNGTYGVTVRDLGQGIGLRYAYRIRVTPALPSLEATVTNDRFTMTAGKPLDIPVTLNRQRFAGEVDFAVDGLDPDTTATLAAPTGKPDPKNLTIRLESKTAKFSGPIRIRVFRKSDPTVSCIATASLAEFEKSSRDLWITIRAKE